tara:strand:- start:20 stop:556 length:537 start_codon:yes stop_codon:yes gene_type:complete
MAHFAKLGINGKVIANIVVDNSKVLNADGVEDENIGISWLEENTGWPLWKKTSYNTRKGVHYTEQNNEDGTFELVESADQSNAFRANYGTIGFVYDEDLDIFKQSSKPFSSWTLNTTTGYYEAPVAEPTETQKIYEGTKQYFVIWDDSNNRWLGSKTTSNMDDMTHVWNPSTSSWDTI